MLGLPETLTLPILIIISIAFASVASLGLVNMLLFVYGYRQLKFFHKPLRRMDLSHSTQMWLRHKQVLLAMLMIGLVIEALLATSICFNIFFLSYPAFEILDHLSAMYALAIVFSTVCLAAFQYCFGLVLRIRCAVEMAFLVVFACVASVANVLTGVGAVADVNDFILNASSNEPLELWVGICTISGLAGLFLILAAMIAQAIRTNCNKHLRNGLFGNVHGRLAVPLCFLPLLRIGYVVCVLRSLMASNVYDWIGIMQHVFTLVTRVYMTGAYGTMLWLLDKVDYIELVTHSDQIPLKEVTEVTEITEQVQPDKQPSSHEIVATPQELHPEA